jgi:hypothetical protein
MRRHQRYYRAHLPDGTHVKGPVAVCKRVIARPAATVEEGAALEPPTKRPADTVSVSLPPAVPPRKPYDPSRLLHHNPEEAAAFREWILVSPLVFTGGCPAPKRPAIRVDLVRDTLPKEDAADRPLLDQQDALARRMILSVTGDDGEGSGD